MYIIAIPTKYKDVDLFIEKLQMVDLYNVYYEAPIVVTTYDYGYDFYENTEETVLLKICLECEESECTEYIDLVKNTLAIKEALKAEKADENSWQIPFETIDLGNGWTICSPASSEENGNIIYFESQGAFGTGLHETTQDCLRFILEEDYSDRTVLDVGTGSGILSIAAGIRNAKEVIALDIRDVSEEVNFNATLNNLNNIKVEVGNVLSEDFNLNKNFEDIIINIGGEEALSMLSFINSVIEPKGRLLVSGLVEWSHETVCREIEACGYNFVKKAITNEWVTVLFEKSTK